MTGRACKCCTHHLQATAKTTWVQLHRVGFRHINLVDMPPGFRLLLAAPAAAQTGCQRLAWVSALCSELYHGHAVSAAEQVAAAAS